MITAGTLPEESYRGQGQPSPWLRLLSAPFFPILQIPLWGWWGSRAPALRVTLPVHVSPTVTLRGCAPRATLGFTVLHLVTMGRSPRWAGVTGGLQGSERSVLILRAEQQGTAGWRLSSRAFSRGILGECGGCQPSRSICNHPSYPERESARTGGFPKAKHRAAEIGGPLETPRPEGVLAPSFATWSE